MISDEEIFSTVSAKPSFVCFTIDIIKQIDKIFAIVMATKSGYGFTLDLYCKSNLLKTLVPQSRVICYLKMYKISGEVINFIEKTMKTWRVELTAGGESLADVKIQRVIFQGDTLSPILLIIAMMPLNHILWKFTAEYKLCQSQEKINHLMYMDESNCLLKMKKNWKH